MKKNVTELGRYFKRGIRQGLWPLQQRFIVAPKIMQLPPVELKTSNEFGVHVRICESDAIMLHWALRSLLNVVNIPFQLTIHDDGSCSEQTLSLLAEKFIGITIIKREDAAKRVLPLLKDYPTLLQWWPTTYRSLKWLDIYLLGNTRYIIFLDSDILFFQEPIELFRACPTTVWMQDSSYMLYVQPQESVELFGGYPLPQLNSGLGRMERSRFNLELAEKVLRHLKSPRDDQTLNAVITAQFSDHELLPSSYDCATALGLENKIAKHYTTPFRFWFYEEGIPRVSKLLNMPLHLWLQERP